MLFRKPILDGIKEGRITLAFRRWRRPSVKAGGTQLTPIGQLSITGVERVALDEITEEDAMRAGFDSLPLLLKLLTKREAGDIYRIELGALSADPRHALRNDPVTEEDLVMLCTKLERMDTRAADGPWTRQVLALIDTHPARRAGDLCEMMGQEKAPFKRNVRKLKAHGLTESLEVGYRLSPRGQALLKFLREEMHNG